MALNWSIAEVENYEELLDENKCLKAPFEGIVLATIQVGLDEITNKNWEEFYKRINFVEKVTGCYYYKDGKPLYITQDEIKRLIGMHTNATKKTKTQFLNQFIHYI